MADLELLLSVAQHHEKGSGLGEDRSSKLRVVSIECISIIQSETCELNDD